MTSRRAGEKPPVRRQRRLLVVSYRLPFRLEEGKLAQNAGGLVSALFAYARAHGSQSDPGGFEELVWIGASTNSAAELASAEREADMPRVRLVPVTIPPRLDRQFYEGCSNDLIWPLFHSFPDLADFRATNYEAYQKANALFCRLVEKEARDGDVIWVHDYHLLLLPGMLRQALPAAAIGLFLHIPFPSFEIFRLIPRTWRVALLEGMLGAHLVGFHTQDYATHFLEAVSRCLDGATDQMVVDSVHGRSRVGAFPIGIDAREFELERNTAAVQQCRDDIRRAIGDHRLMFSVDRLDYTKGLLQRLLAYEEFLERFPRWLGEIVFNMVVIPSRDTIPRYQKMKKEIESTVGRINGLYSTLDWRPIVYQYRSIPRAELIALYDMADIGLITPMRDGMNLVAKEFVACQPPHRSGVLILSEMTGAAAELREALLINPNDRSEIADAIATALLMSDEQRRSTWTRLRDRVFANDVFTWAEEFLDGVYSARSGTAVPTATGISPAGFRKMREAYRKAAQRVILLDYDGTLVPFHRIPSEAVPDDRVRQVLSHLAADTANQLAIVSGRSTQFLERWFGKEPVTLFAEHGAFRRHPGGDWQQLQADDKHWKNAVIACMRQIWKRSPGAAIEEKATAVVWHYRDMEPVSAKQRTADLERALHELLNDNSDLQIVRGDRIVEVRPKKFSKMHAAREFIGTPPPPFILAIGDDRTDEDLFAAVPPPGYTVKVGNGPTRAAMSVTNPGQVLALLEGLISPASMDPEAIHGAHRGADRI